MVTEGTSASTPTTVAPTLRRAVRTEFHRVVQPPFETLITVAVNGALMSSAWFFLPTKLRDAFFTLHGTLAFALVLGAWMYSDVPSTNVLGPDAALVLAALGDRTAFRRLLFAKNVALWLLITPVCLVVAVVNGVWHHSFLSILYTAVWLGVVPFGMLALTNLVGVRFPYHPIPIRARWEYRRPIRHKLVRWATLIVIPYVGTPLVGVLIMVPTLLIWGFTSPHGLSGHVPDNHVGLGVAVACVIALGCAAIGHRLAWWITQRRHSSLVAYLSDPSQG